MFSFLDPVLLPLHDLLDALSPVLPAGAAVVLLTLLVRLALHPLNRRTQHQSVRRRELEPALAELRHRHRDDPAALQKAMLELHREQGVPLAPGCLTALIQIPVFGLVYRLFAAPEIGGEHNRLLDHTFLGTPLSQHLVTAASGQQGVFFALIGLTLAAAAFSAWQLRRHLAEDRAAAAELAAAATKPGRTAPAQTPPAGGARREHGAGRQGRALPVLRHRRRGRHPAAGRGALPGDQHDLGVAGAGQPAPDPPPPPGWVRRARGSAWASA